LPAIKIDEALNAYSSHFNVLLEQVKKLYFLFGDEKFASSFPVTILVKADAIVL